jgi:tetratricopeptide (TPR) repeat protein
MIKPTTFSETQTPEALLTQVASLLSNGQAQLALRVAEDGMRDFPSNADLCNLAGICAVNLGDHPQAEQYWRHTMAINPNFAQSYFNLGLLHANMKRDDQAEQCYRQAVALDPGNAMTHFTLGMLLQNRNKDEEAEHCFRAVITLDPGNVAALTNLGNLLTRGKRMEEAEHCYRRAVTLDPSSSHGYIELGILLEKLKRYDEAELCYRQAFALDPESVIALTNLGILLANLTREQEAEQCFRRALALDPSDAHAHFGFSFLLLRQGRFSEGWQQHEARHDPSLPAQNRFLHPINAPFPQWRGESLAGKSLLICPEQGLGDELQFCRYVPLLKNRGASRISLICKPPLKPLLEMLEGVDTVIGAMIFGPT